MITTRERKTLTKITKLDNKNKKMKRDRFINCQLCLIQEVSVGTEKLKKYSRPDMACRGLVIIHKNQIDSLIYSNHPIARHSFPNKGTMVKQEAVKLRSP